MGQRGQIAEKCVANLAVFLDRWEAAARELRRVVLSGGGKEARKRAWADWHAAMESERYLEQLPTIRRLLAHYESGGRHAGVESPGWAGRGES